MKIEGIGVTRVVLVDGVLLQTGPSLKVWNHSPDGFNWGYEGSGPAQLALAILLAAGYSPKEAVPLHQAFKRAFIAPLPQEADFLIDVDVAAWVHAQ